MTRPILGLVLVVSLLSGGVQAAPGQKPDPLKEEKTNHWRAIKRLAEAKDYAGAAKLAVEELEGNYPDREYMMWKWWETTFGDRKDYREMSRLFEECLFDLYEHSTAKRRRVIAETLGHPNFDVSKSAADFRLAIEKEK
jgi:hypothetical protein